MFLAQKQEQLPKQFLSLMRDGEKMIQKTVSRLGSLVAPEDVFVVTNESYASFNSPNSLWKIFFIKPAARNTAPCIGLAATVIRKKYVGAVMAVLPVPYSFFQGQTPGFSKSYA